MATKRLPGSMDPLALLVATLSLVLLTPLLVGGAVALVVRWLAGRTAAPA